MSASRNFAFSSGAPPFGKAAWPVVRRTDRDRRAQAGNSLEVLCHTYRYAAYAYIHQQAAGVAAAERETWDFFAWFLQEKQCARFARVNGRFRCALLAALREYRATESAGNDGDGTPAALDAERFYDEVWALAVCYEALNRVREEYVAAGRVRQFNQMKVFLSNDPALWVSDPGISLFLKTPGAAIAMAVASDRLRLRYGELVRAEIARIVSTPADLEEEMRHLFGVLHR